MKNLKLVISAMFLLLSIGLHAQKECTCDDLLASMTFGPIEEFNDECCVIRIDVLEVTCVFDYVLTYNGITFYHTFDPDGSVTGFIPTSCFGESGYYSMSINGELCTERTFGCTPCELGGCGLSLSLEDECTIKACANGKCAAPNTFTMTRPDGSTVGWSIGPGLKPCRKIEVDQNGEYCVTLTDAEGCEFTECIEVTDCKDCNCSITTLTESSCHIRACVSDFMTDCEGPLTYQWSTPSGLSPPGQITNPVSFVTCSGIDAVEDGTYCVTLTDANGCTSSGCIDVEGCAECDPNNPNWLEPNVSNPHIRWWGQSPTIGRLRMTPQLIMYPECDECCQDIHYTDKNIRYTVNWLVYNHTQGIQILDHTSDWEHGHCGGVLNSAGSHIVDCDDVDMGDELEFSWVIMIDNLEGCGYVGPNPVTGSITHIVTSSEVSECCK